MQATDESGAVNGGEEGKPVEVRFLDVPGSEETRAEKMTIVFTCTVGVGYVVQTAATAVLVQTRAYRVQFRGSSKVR